jgi:hypothetical protein
MTLLLIVDFRVVGSFVRRDLRWPDGCVPCNSSGKLHGEPVGCQARKRPGQGP